MPELLWHKTEQGWDTVQSPVDEMDSDDVLASYSTSARVNNVVLQICKAPNNVNSTRLTVAKAYISTTDDTSQSDTGANANITPHINLLSDVYWFSPVTIGNAQKGGSMTVEAIGKYPVATDSGVLKINMYYCPSAANTIISPSAICLQYNTFVGFHQFSNLHTGKGYLAFVQSDSSCSSVKVRLQEQNGLWYHEIESGSYAPLDADGLQVNALSDAAKYELWHQRLGHCGAWVLENAHKHVGGVPKLKGNAFFKCPSCMSGKLCTKRSNAKGQRQLGTVVDYCKTTCDIDQRDTTYLDPVIEDFLDEIHLPSANPGQHFHIDFGFVRGSGYHKINDQGRTVTSIDGKNSYLLIVDRKTRYMWLYLADNKSPPLQAVRMVLEKFGSTDKHRTVRTDQDKSLGKSKSFLAMLESTKFTLELTGTDNSQQNSRVERPHRDLAQMMRCMLHSSGLGPEYWSHALVMAVYIKNRVPHQSLECTPFEALTGRRPNFKRLRVFGSRVQARKPGARPAKLDHHTDSGVFLSFTATDSNINFLDDTTGLIKTCTHVIFDEAHLSVHARKAPLAAEALQRLGYSHRESWTQDQTITEAESTVTSNELLVQLLSPTAKMPIKGTDGSIGFDLFADTSGIVIPPGESRIVQTGIAAEAPEGSYLRIAPRSGLTVKHHLNTLAGVIDPDYRGNICVVLYNFGKIDQYIQMGDKIAQMIPELASKPILKSVSDLSMTTRNFCGFGSTGTTWNQDTPKVHHKLHLPTSQIDSVPVAAAATSLSLDTDAFSDLHLAFDMPYNIDFSENPFEFFYNREINISGEHPSLGLILEQCENLALPRLKTCLKSTPAAKLPRWRSELKQSYMLSVNGSAVSTCAQVIAAISAARTRKETTILVTFGSFKEISHNSQLGIPQLFHDQMNVIAKHLWELDNDPSYGTSDSSLGLDSLTDIFLKREDREILDGLHDIVCHSLDSSTLSKRKGKLTRRKLMKCSDWNDWEASEFKQLDQYHEQGTFGEPQPLPAGSNVLNLLWTYLIKDDGRKKARCVCNGSKRMRGAVTLAETYASSLEQTGARIF